MKALLVSTAGDGAWFVWLLRHEGWDCDWLLAKDKHRDTLRGLIPPPLEHGLDPASYDLVVFDSTGMGKVADYARTLTPTIGDSSLADQLEHDRIFGLEAMEHAGIRVPAWEHFDSPDKGLAWLRKTKKRCVFKPLGGGDDSACTYVSKSAEDMEHYLNVILRRVKVKEFVFQEFVSGTEISTEAWWTGSEWVALNHTLEEKKFLAGGLGPNTGCSGNVVWMPVHRTPVFERGLEKIGDFLREQNYVGMMDLNTIVTDGEVYGIEWTPRFGYEGTCNLTRLLPMPFGEFMYEVANGRTPTLAQPKHKFAATVRLSAPPYPSTVGNREKLAGTPIVGIDTDHLDAFYLANAKVSESGDLETDTVGDAIGCPIGCGETIEQAVAECQIAIDKLFIPDLMYRNDIEKKVKERYVTLERQGWLRALTASFM